MSKDEEDDSNFVIGVFLLGLFLGFMFMFIFSNMDSRTIPIKTLNELCADTLGKEYMYDKLIFNHDEEKDYKWKSIKCKLRPNKPIKEYKGIVHNGE